MTELLVGTKKGLFRLEGDAGNGGFEVTARAFAGQSVEYAMRDSAHGPLPRLGHLVVLRAAGSGSRTTRPASGSRRRDRRSPRATSTALARIWVIVPGEADGVLYAGGDPGPLFESRDGGLTWALNRGLWDHPTRTDWEPGAGGLCLHTIAPVARRPVEAARRDLRRRVSGSRTTAARRGATRTRGSCREYLPEDARDETPIQHCVHDVRRSPVATRAALHAVPRRRLPLRRRRRERGSTSARHGAARPTSASRSSSTPPIPDSAYVIPLIGAEDRTTPGGQVQVWETRDAGATWTPRGDGPPAAGRVPDRPPRGVRLGRRGRRARALLRRDVGRRVRLGGRGRSWTSVAEHLPPVYSVRAA